MATTGLTGQATGDPTPAEQRIGPDVTPDVERVLGRAPQNFGGWVRRHLSAFR
ncbi:hypothetical protein HUT19_02410 [Streptomyces sp. NA02950]|uniref:hypothetical protein n=1 Tax=Streptomyces sp. NA02950 TaxID=2742137 RepID=UPI001591C916|nr:hypothetical protein HUT19_02410 [Streptomyces sp. NA02950]